ncbi:MAG: hypothetical protein AMXMBFR33_45190 [Candidatus Xenobia bacterium]
MNHPSLTFPRFRFRARRRLPRGEALAMTKAGALVWLLALIGLRPDWPGALVWFAAQVLVPLGMPAESRLRRLQPAFALCAGASLFLPRGPLSAAVACGWLIFAALLALETLLKHRFWPAEQLTATAAPVFLTVGALWFVAFRGGFPLLGFNGLIVVLTAAHFHYAGWALSTLAARLAERQPAPLTRGAALAVMGGMPIVAAGITFSPLLEWLGAWAMAASAILVAFLQMRLEGDRVQRALFLTSGFCLVAGMGLALVYSRSEYHGHGDLEPMLRWHSTLNSLGFSLLGLLGWQRSAR